MSPSITLALTLDEIKGILQVLGDLPTKTNAYPLLMKIQQQTQEQMPAPEPEQ